ncbi:hypothetical protein HanRHA438_Chr16g0785181 [Helianthus annuus]|nr:hypothetical protein HanRHA438_Chr16g0785181 [Helianthus annuus]
MEPSTFFGPEFELSVLSEPVDCNRENSTTASAADAAQAADSKAACAASSTPLYLIFPFTDSVKLKTSSKSKAHEFLAVSPLVDSPSSCNHNLFFHNRN